MDHKKPTGLESEESKAKRLLNNPFRTRKLADRAERKARENRGRLGEMWVKLTGFIRMTRAWSKGDYKKVSIKTMILVVAAILYFLNPFDLVPDYFPFLGYLDDVTVIGFVANSISGDIEKFLAWEKMFRK